MTKTATRKPRNALEQLSASLAATFTPDAKPAKTKPAQLNGAVASVETAQAQTREAIRAARYPSQGKASSKATGAKAAKVAAAADKAEAKAAVARVKEANASELLAKVAGLQLEGSITARCWALFNAMGAPGTFERKVALEAALSHGINPTSASLAFGRWGKTPDQPRSK